MKLFSFALCPLFIFISSHTLADSKPENAAMVAFKKYGRQVTRLSPDCLTFIPESDQDVGVREKHGGKCGGDPSTSPSVAHLRVQGKKVLILDPISGTYKTLNSKYHLKY